MNSAQDPYQTDLAAVRTRQRRLLDVMQEKNLDLVILTQNAHIQYFVGPRFGWTFSPAAAIAADGRVVLVAPFSAGGGRGRRRAHLRSAVVLHAAQRSAAEVDRRAVRCAGANCPSPSASASSARPVDRRSPPVSRQRPVDIEPEVYLMRRRKDPDELARIRKAIAGTAAMHRRAREIIEPGVNELRRVQRTAGRRRPRVRRNADRHGQRLCLRRAGRPAAQPKDRSRRAVYSRSRPGVSWILCRQHPRGAVGGKPTDAQLEAWQHILPVFEMVERK